MATDWRWCYENPQAAAALIDKQDAIIQQAIIGNAEIVARGRRLLILTATGAQLDALAGFTQRPTGMTDEEVRNTALHKSCG